MAFPSGTMPSRVQTETIIETGTYSYECWLTEDFITGCRLCAIFSIFFLCERLNVLLLIALLLSVSCDCSDSALSYQPFVYLISFVLESLFLTFGYLYCQYCFVLSVLLFPARAVSIL